MESTWLWIGFAVVVLGMLALDLGVLHRKAHAVSIKEAALWSGVWITLSLLFAAVVWVWRGHVAGLEFLTAYLIEKSLSVDNIFVFVLIFAAFAVPASYQHRVLFWGILGALVMRGLLIGAGAALVHQFHWILYLFGIFLVITGARLLVKHDGPEHPEQNRLVALFRRHFPITRGFEGSRFLVRREGRLWATPLLLVLVVVESSDLMFATDSIPAVFAVTQDPFIVYTSNVFAILGLRALYFLLAGVITRFYYLRPALSAILTFVGFKMLVADLFEFPIHLSLLVIGGLLGVAILASMVRARRLASTEARAASAHIGPEM